MTNDQKYLALPSPESFSGLPANMERIAFYQAPQPEPESESSAIPFAHYLWLIGRHKWRLLLFVAIAVGATIFVSIRLTPYYESTATIDVDRMAPSGVVGAEASGARTSLNDSDTFLSTQLQLIKSDSVLRPVIQKLKIKVSKSEKRDVAAEEAPAVLPYLTVTRPPKTYLVQISYRSPDRAFAAQVANEIAQSYIAHSYDIRFKAAGMQAVYMNRELEELQAKMERSASALAQFDKVMGFIDPEAKTNILSARLLKLNEDWANAQGDRGRKEAAYNAVSGGSVDALQASLQGEQIRKLAERLGEDSEKFSSVKAEFGVNHPEYKKAAVRHAQLDQQFEDLKVSVVKRVESEYHEALDREKVAQQAVVDTKKEFDELNSRSVQYKALKQEADADRTLYDDLTRKTKEAGINAGFQGSSIRLADAARPGKSPVFPRIPLNAVIAFLVSTFVGVVIIFVSDNLDHTLRDPEQIQRQLQTEVLGALPVVKAWRGHLPGVDSQGNRRELFGSAATAASTYEEAVRTLRDSILLPSADRRPRTLLMTSATPREGKTTTAVHLAVVHSQQKRKTLIIDCDLRRPGVYHHVGVSNDRGMADVVNGQAAWRDMVQTADGLPYLSVLPAGQPSRRAADGIGETLREVLAEAVLEYDLVMCDAPPLLGFAESLQIAALVDGVVVVALAGQTERTAVSSVLTNLKRLKANVIGLALNEVRSDMSDRYYYYGYYGKNYSRYYKPLSS